MLCGFLNAHAGPVSNFRDEAPKIVAPFDGLVDVALLRKSDLQSIPDISEKTVAIILSANTSAHLKWSESNMAGVGGVDRFFGSIFGVLGAGSLEKMDQVIKDGYNPALITDSVLKPLLERAKKIKVMNDLNEFRDSGYDLAAVVDISFVNVFSDGFFTGTYEVGTDVKVLFLDRGLRLGPVVEAKKRVPVERDKFLFEVVRVRSEVFADYQGKMSRVLTTPPRGTAPEAQVPDLSSRLVEIERLRKAGLITGDEAEQKRKQLLDQL